MLIEILKNKLAVDPDRIAGLNLDQPNGRLSITMADGTEHVVASDYSNLAKPVYASAIYDKLLLAGTTQISITVTAEDVRRLRELTGEGLMACKKALNLAEGDVEAAVNILRRAGT